MILRDFEYRLSELLNVLGWHKESIHVIFDDIQRSAFGKRNYRLPSCHRFEKNNPQSLRLFRTDHEHIQFLHHPHHLFPGDEPPKLDLLCQAMALDGFMQ